jgi:hypothetical protein
VIISVGYGVNSHRGTQFRIWATQRLREYVEVKLLDLAGDLARAFALHRCRFATIPPGFSSPSSKTYLTADTSTGHTSGPPA